MTVGPVLYLLDGYVELSQTFVREEIRELRARGVTVHVVALSRGDTAPDPDEPVTYLTEHYRGKATLAGAWLARMTRRPAGAVRAMRAAALYRSEAVPWRNLAALADDVEAWGCTWIHSHFGWQAAATANVLAELTGLPWSMTLHARDIFVEDRHLREKIERVSHLVTVCRYNLDELRAMVPDLPPTSIAVCGVRVPDLPDERERGADVVAVGRLVEKKGFDVLLDALPELVRRQPHVTVQIVGDGPLRADLEAQAARLGVADHVEFTGALAHDDVLTRICGARVMCLPARIAADGDRDSMPVVIKEAMARAVPVVASDLVAIPEMVDASTGVLVPPEDPAALAESLADLLGDAERARRMGEAGRRRVARDLTLGHQAEALLAVFADAGRS